MNNQANEQIDVLSQRVEPIIISGKSFGLKLLSVYEFLKCELACKNLVDKLTVRGFSKKICEEVAERACIVSSCTYTKDHARAFSDGLAVLMALTPEELDDTYQQYEKLTRKVIKFNKEASDKINYIKTNYRAQKL